MESFEIVAIHSVMMTDEYVSFLAKMFIVRAVKTVNFQILVFGGANIVKKQGP